MSERPHFTLNFSSNLSGRIPAPSPIAVSKNKTKKTPLSEMYVWFPYIHERCFAESVSSISATRLVKKGKAKPVTSEDESIPATCVFVPPSYYCIGLIPSF